MHRSGGPSEAPSYAPSVRSSSGLTQASSITLPNCPDVYIRRADIGASLQAYERLLGASKAYTSTMLAMSKASSELAEALEDCSRVKGAHAMGPAFQAAGGLHYLKSNYEQVLCDTFWKEFSIPLLDQLDVYRTTVRERQVTHEKAIAEKSRLLKEIETKYQKEERRRKRDLNSFRLMLSELQEKLNELEEIKAQHYTDALEYEEQTWEYLASKVGLLVRAQTEIAERLTSKSGSDPVLESITAAIPDPFNSYGPPKRGDELFTILPPSTAASSSVRLDSETSTPATGLPRVPTEPAEPAEVSSSSRHAPYEAPGRGALFSPRTPVSDEAEDATPTRAFLASQIHAQPSYGSLFGYSAERTAQGEDQVADDLESKLHVDKEEPSTPEQPARRPPVSPSQWPSDKGVWE